MLHPLPPPNVVSLDAARAVRHQPVLAVVEDYWDSLRDGRLLPGRDEIDPRALSGALSRAFLVERIAPGQARFRVAGSHLADLVGMEVRGMPVSALFEPEARTRLSEALEAAFAAPAVVRMALSSAGGIGRPALTGGMVLLPLIERGEVRAAFGAMSMGECTGRPPRRLGIRSLARRDLGLELRAGLPR